MKTSSQAQKVFLATSLTCQLSKEINLNNKEKEYKMNKRIRREPRIMWPNIFTTVGHGDVLL